MPVLYPKYRHSVSSANLWRDCPSAFLWRYGMQRWGTDNARTWMGKAAEAAYANALLHGLSPEEANDDAIGRFYGLSEGEDHEHAGHAGTIAQRFVEATDPAWGKLVQHSPWRPIMIGPLSREISFRPDFVFENALVDTKATLQIKSDPSSGHVRQISAYAKEWGLPGVLFYASPKKHHIVTVSDEDMEIACRALLMDWKQIEAWDRRFDSVTDAMCVTPLNTDSFYWDADQIEEATSMWMQSTEEGRN